MPNLANKKIVIIIASRDFRDEEFSQPAELLAKAGATVSVACSKKDPSKGVLGRIVTPDLLLSDVQAADYDAVIFVGGQGAQEYFDNPTAHTVARDAVREGKILAAICIAPATLANAGVLKNKKATCFSSSERALIKGGAQLEHADVVRDANLITANGPKAARKFAEAICAALTE